MTRARKNRQSQHGDHEFETLVAQESFLRQILDINPNLIFAKDREGRFTLVNQAVADIYGTTIDQLVGKTDADFNSDPEQVAHFRRMDLQVMDSLKELLIPEEVITDAAGKRHWLQTVKRPIIGHDGTANQVLGVATDITHRRELEEQLRQSQKMEAIGQLAGGIAHDFNNMLAVILGNAERLLAKYKHQSRGDRSLCEGLDLIESAGIRAADLVRQLLTFSRKHPVAPIVLNLGEVVSSLNELLQTMIGENITLAVHRHDLDTHILIDRGRLEQLIVNLIVNARDAMPSGGRIAIETRALNRRKGADSSNISAGPCVTMSVSDTGMGIPADIKDRIFEPFFSTKERGKGTGLGLSIVYGVVQQAGGHISLESKPGQGTMFRITFPAVNDPLTPAPTVSPANDGRGNETILICEDERDVLRLLCDILTDHGYRVLFASQGSKAVQVAREFAGDIHLLLTDVVMPGMTGRQLADAIRSTRPGLKVLFITGYPADVLGSLDDLKGCHRVISKPFQAAAILQSIRAVLDACPVG